MAGFNNTESQGEENVVQPVSFQRLQSLVARNGWNVGTPEQVENPQFLYAYFDGVYTVFSTEHDNCLMVSAFGINNLTLSLDRFEDAVMWAADHNLGTNFGTSFITSDEDEGTVMLRVDSAILCPAGATDEQLVEWVNVALSANLAAMKRFAEHFDVQIEQR